MGFGSCVNQVLEFKEGFVDNMNEFFGRYALYVYDHPIRVSFMNGGLRC